MNELEGDVVDIQKRLQRYADDAHKNGYDSAEINFDYHSYRFSLTVSRKETDEEYEKRLASVKMRQQRQKVKKEKQAQKALEAEQAKMQSLAEKLGYDLVKKG